MLWRYGLWNPVLSVNVVIMPDVRYIVLPMRDMVISLRWNEYLRILRYAAVYIGVWVPTFRRALYLQHNVVQKNFLGNEGTRIPWKYWTYVQVILETMLYQMTEIFICIIFLSLCISNLSLLHCQWYRLPWSSRILLRVITVSYFQKAQLLSQLWQNFLIRSCLQSPHQHAQDQVLISSFHMCWRTPGLSPP